MNVKVVMQYADIALLISSVSLMVLMSRRGAVRKYASLFGLIAVRAAMTCVSVGILFHRKELGFSKESAYFVYFCSYWSTAVLSLVLQVATIYTVYRIAMKPLDGLKRIGTIIFRWVSCVSIVLSGVVILGPHVSGSNYLSTLLAQVQEGVSVLTVCLLLFVCFAIRPLGLTYRSRLFGISLGLGINSVSSMVLSPWLTTEQARSLYSPIFLFYIFGGIVVMFVWAGYFAFPEPARKMILLPTTSPYFLWNRISEALGDEPGVVAVAGFTPAMLAPAEMAAINALHTSSLPSPRIEELVLAQPLALSR